MATIKKICRNCKSWTRNTWEWTTNHAGKCVDKHFKYIGDGKHKTPTNGLGYDDAGEETATFETGENFGCIHFDQRND